MVKLYNQISFSDTYHECKDIMNVKILFKMINQSSLNYLPSTLIYLPLYRQLFTGRTIKLWEGTGSTLCSPC